MTVFMFALAIPYDNWKTVNHTGFVTLYALTFFFLNFGPNATTFIVPAELFPARPQATVSLSLLSKQVPSSEVLDFCTLLKIKIQPSGTHLTTPQELA